MKKVIVEPYAPNIMDATRAMGYSFESAIADIMDNSIAKGATEINVLFDSNYPNQYIAIMDDACGMSEEELIDAMRYGNKMASDERDLTDLGRFGLGLKTASLSQCRKLTVITKKDKKISAACWDLDYIDQENDWSLQVLDITEIRKNSFYGNLSSQEHGTVVIWENFDRLLKDATTPSRVFDEKMELAREHVALVFHRFMSGYDSTSHRLKIFFNNDRVLPIDPFLSDNPATQLLDEETLNLYDSHIKVKPYVLPHAVKLTAKDKKNLGDIAELRNKQGFYIYRNKRLIIWGTWFRLIKQHELNKLARVRVDIPNTLDFIWEIDVKKSSASLPDTIKRNLANIVIRAVGRSESVFSYRGRKVTTDAPSSWVLVEDRQNYRYQINRDLPIFKRIENSLPEQEVRYLNTFIQLLENEFPYSGVYYYLAKTDTVASPLTVEEEGAYEMAVNLISTLDNDLDSIKVFVNSMPKHTVFSKYPEVIRKITEEYINER